MKKSTVYISKKVLVFFLVLSLVLPMVLSIHEPIARAESYVKIKNRLTGEYLYASGEMALYVTPHTNDGAAQWIIEPIEGTNPVQLRIRNVETGKYLHIANNLGYVECGAYMEDESSQKWYIEDEGSYKKIRSVSVGTQYIHTENKKGYAECSDIGMNWTGAQWTLEVVTDTTPLPRGGTYPWVTYEAEDMTTNGTVLGPSTLTGNFNYASESSGRKCVQLDVQGEYVQFTASKAANSIVVRVSIPDSPSGGGIDGTLSLYVDGVQKTDINLTSRYSYIYNYEQIDDKLWSDDPAAGELSRFYFGESKKLLSDLDIRIEPGSLVKLQIDSGDMGSAPGQFCVVDLIELEDVAPAGTMPSGYYSITDFGAVPNDGIDDTTAIKNCINAVMSDHAAGVWIPKGIFQQNDNIEVENITLRGAGMWHSEIVHTLVEPYMQRTVDSASITAIASNSGPVRIYDLALSGTAPYDQTQSGALRGRFGDGSVFQNLWIEHQQVGMWLAYWPDTGGVEGLTNGLYISGCRVRNTWADGINLCTSVQNGTVVNCHVRGTQDDSFAQWSNPKNEFYTKNNTFKFCTAQVVLRGNCFAVYGGTNTLVMECVGIDTCHKSGIIASSAFNMTPFVNTEFKGIDLTRCGGLLQTPTGYSLYGAVGLLTQKMDIDGVKFTDITVTDPTYYGIHFLDANSNYLIKNTQFKDITVSVTNSVYKAIKVNSGVDDGGYLGATFENVVVTPDAGQGLQNSSSTFTIAKVGTGSRGWYDSFEIVIDNRAAQYTGTWGSSTAKPNYYDLNYAYNQSGTGEDKVRWTPNIPTTGTYNVYYRLPDGDTSRASNAPFTVYFDGGSQTYLVNERVSPGGQWILLGTHPFAAGTTGYVELTDNANGTYVTADAILFQQVTPLP